MKCKVCGLESGKYPLCRACNVKRETGEIIKCTKCNHWHYAAVPCNKIKPNADSETKFLYALKPSLVTNTESKYLTCIKSVLPEGYLVQPQANLASFIIKTDGSRFQNELYRNVDFIITDLTYKPMVIIEINDQTHLTPDRRARDEKVKKICEEAGIPIIKLWTSYGVNSEYISKRIKEAIASMPIDRVPHFMKEKPEQSDSQETIPAPAPTQPTSTHTPKKSGCYIATCVYGSYDCPQVWTLRRFRDNTLSRKWYGRALIQIYYTVSPLLVKTGGNSPIFKAFFKKPLDFLVCRLHSIGVEDTPYNDI